MFNTPETLNNFIEKNTNTKTLFSFLDRGKWKDVVLTAPLASVSKEGVIDIKDFLMEKNLLEIIIYNPHFFTKDIQLNISEEPIIKEFFSFEHFNDFLQYRAQAIVFKSLNMLQQNQINKEDFLKILKFYGLPLFDDFNSPTWRKAVNLKLKDITVEKPWDEDVVFTLQKAFLKELFKSTTIKPTGFETAHFLKIDNLNKRDIKKIHTKFDNVNEKFKQSGFIPLAVFLQGSQNYDLNTETSDFDFKSFVIRNSYFSGRGKISHTMSLGQVEQNYGMLGDELLDVKGSAEMIDSLLKGNHLISHLEVFFSKAIMCDVIFKDVLNDLFERKLDFFKLNRANVWKGLLGFMNEKLTALTKPFPSKLPVIEKYGYDPKQLLHLQRLEYQLELFKKMFIEKSVDKNQNLYEIKDQKVFQQLKEFKLKPPILNQEQLLEIKTQWTQKVSDYYKEYREFLLNNEASIQADFICLEAFLKEKIIPQIALIEKQIWLEDITITLNNSKVKKTSKTL